MISEAAAQLRTCRALGVNVVTEVPERPDVGDDVVIDGLVGSELIGPLRGAVQRVTRWANSTVSPVVALGPPSGLDPDRGPLEGLAIRATSTLALAAPMRGLKHPDAPQYAGELFLADIGVPPQVFDAPSLRRLNGYGPVFGQGDLLRLASAPRTTH